MRTMSIGPFVRNAVVILSVVMAAPGVLAAAQRSDSPDRAATGQSEDPTALASTPTEHAAVITGLLEMAVKYEADAEAHVAMAARYRRDPHARSGSEDPGVPCDRMAQRARTIAATARDRAAQHERLAGNTAK